MYCAKAHLPDSPPPFFLCAWATPLRGTSVTLGRRAHSPDKQVGGGGKPLDTLSEVLPGEAGLQITDLNPRPAAQNRPKGQLLVGLLSRGSLTAEAGNGGASLGSAADWNRHSLLGPFT